QINALTPFKNYEAKIFYYAMITKGFQLQVLSHGKGAQATLPIINKSKWENLFLHIPEDTEKQKEIINTLDLLREKVIALEKKYRSKLTQLEELKKSILQKAFTGQLTAKEVII